MRNRDKHNPKVPRYGKSGSISTQVALHGMTSPAMSASDPAPKPPRPASDFDGLHEFDLAIGEVYGIRVWRMDSLGRLRARNTTAPAWRPGVNQAQCHRHQGGLLSMPSLTFQIYGGPFGYEAHPEPPKVCTQPPSEGCGCGFYAYTDPLHEEAAGNAGQQLVLGVIRGTGRTLVGTKGFRCEKAEILALRDPTRGGRKETPWRRDQVAKLARLYPDVPLLPSRADLLAFAPIEPDLPDPSSDEFWNLP